MPTFRAAGLPRWKRALDLSVMVPALPLLGIAALLVAALVYRRGQGVMAESAPIQ